MWYLYDKTWTVTDVPQPWSSKEFARNLHRSFLIYSFFIEIMLFWNEDLFSMWFLLVLEMDFWLQESLSIFFLLVFLLGFFISSQDNQDIKMKGHYQQAELTDDGFLKRSQSYCNDSDRSAKNNADPDQSEQGLHCLQFPLHFSGCIAVQWSYLVQILGRLQQIFWVSEFLGFLP